MDRRLLRHLERAGALIAGRGRPAAMACLLAVSGSLLPTGPAFAASELSRKQTTVTVERNAIAVDRDVTYGGYAPGERLDVAVEYSATCKVVFKSLALFRASPFAPVRTVTGDLGNIRGTPPPNHAATTGMVTFDLRFNTLGQTPAGGQTGLARLDLVLGVDKDCDLATGDTDGVDRSVTIRIQVRVFSGTRADDSSARARRPAPDRSFTTPAASCAVATLSFIWFCARIASPVETFLS